MDTTELLAQVDILDYISQYCEFTEKGGEYWALSPFKEENTPSFSVDPIKQFFYEAFCKNKTWETPCFKASKLENSMWFVLFVTVVLIYINNL